MDVKITSLWRSPNKWRHEMNNNRGPYTKVKVQVRRYKETPDVYTCLAKKIVQVPNLDKNRVYLEACKSEGTQNKLYGIEFYAFAIVARWKWNYRNYGTCKEPET